MQPMKRAIITVAIAAVLCAATNAAEPKRSDDHEKAKALFNRYAELEHDFDPTVADLYSDTAIVKNRRIYQTGMIREVTLEASQYKALIRQSMPLAKELGDRSTYTDVTYETEGHGVRIRAQRYSERKQYTSPLSLLVKPDSGGTWLIYEELSESRSFGSSTEFRWNRQRGPITSLPSDNSERGMDPRASRKPRKGSSRISGGRTYAAFNAKPRHTPKNSTTW